jgi:hypothetical protein
MIQTRLNAGAIVIWLVKIRGIVNVCRIPFLVLSLVLLVGAASAFTCYETPTAPDGTCCLKIYNLQESNRAQLAGPVVIDYAESTGNLLVRGPLPLIVRNGTGQAGNCMNQADWHFAYDELNTMMQNKKTTAPAYFSDSKKAALISDMQDFNLDDYRIIDISLLDHGDINSLEFGVLLREFGGVQSTCSAPLAGGTLHGQTGNLISSAFAFCPSIDQHCKDTIDSDVGETCSFSGRIDQLITLMNEKDPSGKKRLIYYHCVLGSDRTGSITIGYLQKTITSLSFIHAYKYAEYLGKESQGGDAIWPPNPAARNAALAYCQKIGADCTEDEAHRVILPGRDTHSHLPGQEDEPVVTPAPTTVPAPVQTPVPAVRYNPAKSDEATF